MNIWEHNDLSRINVEDFEGTKIYWMDDFYKHPDLVFERITKEQPPLWKYDEDDKELMNKGYNAKCFEDRRLEVNDEPGLEAVYDAISKITGQKSIDRGALITNNIRFYNDERSKRVNDYKNMWWWPHKDDGHNAIIYLNNCDHGEDIGTNIYKQVKPIDIMAYHEHELPWIDKSYFERIKFLKAKYNRIVIFDGLNYWHGMAVENDKWFHKTRVNQVLFFDF